MSHRFDAAAAVGSSDQPHVAQQRRRDKLRHHQDLLLINPPPLPTNHHHQDINHFLLHFNNNNNNNMLPPPPSPPNNILLDFSSTPTTINNDVTTPPTPCDWIFSSVVGDYSNNIHFASTSSPYLQNSLLADEQDVVRSFPPPPPPTAPWIDQHLHMQQTGCQQLLSLSLQAASTSTAVGPLGPFTGYAAILKNSRFLRPAQQLLDEFCTAAVSACRPPPAASADRGLVGPGSSTDGAGSSSGATNYDHSPRQHKKKAKLIYLQEEVCRKYKQYHQQMQMVVSSFDSVAGLSAATPYTSLAVKAVSKHFRRVKNAISDQLRQVSKLLGEELVTTSPSSSSRGETMTTPRLKYIDQSLMKRRESEGYNNQPVWRPQRGLPERAVTVLRAWLFEHFLHPYPTDTDKHMLATQTGLSRNQVSNWFINARVRLWKPMVEEIHNLESKGMAEMNLSSANTSVMEDRSLECSSVGPLVNESRSIGVEQWHQDKRTRMDECAVLPQSMDSSGLMSLAYQGGMDLGGLGAVSLTLGLRHSEDSQQQQQQQQMRHFGSHLLHDFVG